MDCQATSAELETDQTFCRSVRPRVNQALDRPTGPRVAQALLGFSGVFNFQISKFSWLFFFAKMGLEENLREKYAELKSVQLKGQRSTGMTFDSGLCLRGGYKGVDDR